MKRAQIEGMGLAIVVILISLSLLFAMIFLKKDDRTIAETQKHKDIATNFLSTAMATNVYDCGDREMMRLLKDCAEQPSYIDCDLDGTTDSCIYFNQTLENLTNQTLKEWGIFYDFTITMDRRTVTNLTHGSCLKDKDRQLSLVPSREGTIIVSLSVCSLN